MHKKEILDFFQHSNQSIKAVIELGESFLIKQGIDNAKNELRWYIQKLYKYDSIGLFKNENKIIEDHVLNQIIDFLDSRASKFPFQYLMGVASFYGRDFIVSQKTLIPRQESEILIDLIKNNKKCKMLDIGTGSGCLAITASLEGVAESVDAIDISSDALFIAKKNAKSLNVQNMNCVKMNILKTMPNKTYDIIISNPPYISSIEYNQLDQEVRGYEPLEALSDMGDGYTFYKRYAIILKKILKKSGIAVFELSHFFNKEIITSIFKDFSNIEFHNDLNNDLRAIRIVND